MQKSMATAFGKNFENTPPYLNYFLINHVVQWLALPLHKQETPSFKNGFQKSQMNFVHLFWRKKKLKSCFMIKMTRDTRMF